MPDDTTIYGDPRYIAVAWTIHSSNATTAQVLGSQRRFLPFLARCEVVDLLCQDRAIRTVDGGLCVDGHPVPPENYLAQWRRTLGHPVSAARRIRALLDGPVYPAHGQWRVRLRVRPDHPVLGELESVGLDFRIEKRYVENEACAEFAADRWPDYFRLIDGHGLDVPPWRWADVMGLPS